MPNTARGFPYPAATDPVTQGAAAIQALAQEIDELAAISYTEITANVSITATAEASANTVITAPAYVADGTTAILLEFFAPFVRTPASAGHAIYPCLFLDGVSLGRLAGPSTPAAAALDIPCLAARRLTPAAGSRIYSIRAFVTTGTGLVAAGAGGVGVLVPAFLRLSRA